MIRGVARGALAIVTLAVALLSQAHPAAAGAYLRWYTVETPHFRVHYHGGLEQVAQRVANLAETARERLIGPMGHSPDDLIHIRLVDNTDSANGSATALPYNTVRLFVTAPEDMSNLGDYDDWMLALVTHELVHVFHMDTISGPAAVLNTILGKTYAPNQVQPRWILEGLAVAMESRLTSGGRLRSTLFDMMLRADVLEHNLAGLDRMSHDVRRWPSGDIWYLYGGKFIGWLQDTYGPDVFAAVAADYGDNLVPWGINRSIRRATGSTYPELYSAWVRSLEDRYGAQVAEVEARGLREGTRLTHRGRSASTPRWIPPISRTGAREELLYFRDDGDTLPGFYRLPLVARDRAAEDDVELVARANGSQRTASFDPEGGIVFDSVTPSVRRMDFDDLHHLGRGLRSVMSLRGSRDRWTVGMRARAPDVSPDGRRVVFVTNHAGTTTVRIANILPEGGLADVRALVASGAEEQAFSPRFSPDGASVAYSAWTRGGYRDIRVVDVRTGSFFEIAHDRAYDTTPSWSRDGRYLLFTSDRTGIANVYAYELATGTLHQVTNVRNGAYMPELSPDGRTLVYVGYTHAGFDLFALPFEPSRFLPAPPASTRPEPPPPAATVAWPVSTYDPLATLRPRSYTLDYGPGSFGQAVTIGVSGSDIVNRHGASLSLTYNTGIDDTTGTFSYSYRVLPVSLTMSGFRSMAPRRPFEVNGASYPTHVESLGVTTGVAYTLPGEMDAQSVALSYTAAGHNARYSVPTLGDPYTTTTPPQDAFTGSVRVAWTYGNSFRPINAISNERGVAISLSSDFAGPATGSSGTLTAVEGRLTAYALAPWLRHHAFALQLSTGTAMGSFAGRGYYSTGGYGQSDTFDAIVSGIQQTSFVLRGFAPRAFIGRQKNLANLEYRFPIAWVDHGPSTLPLYLRGITGALVADYGGAYDAVDVDHPFRPFHLGVGAEVRVGFTLGYFMDTGFRIGWARGIGDAGQSQLYLVVAASF